MPTGIFHKMYRNTSFQVWLLKFRKEGRHGAYRSLQKRTRLYSQFTHEHVKARSQTNYWRGQGSIMLGAKYFSGVRYVDLYESKSNFCSQWGEDFSKGAIPCPYPLNHETEKNIFQKFWHLKFVLKRVLFPLKHLIFSLNESCIPRPPLEAF